MDKKLYIWLHSCGPDAPFGNKNWKLPAVELVK
jgi:hypothetical protein